MVSVHPGRWCTSPLGVVPVGSGGRRWRLSRRRHSSKGASFLFPFCIFLENKIYFFFQEYGNFFLPLGMLVAEWVPTPCYNDAYLVGTPKWAFWRKGG